MVEIKRTGRVGLCEWCGQAIYEGVGWGDPQWFHEEQPWHEITPVYVTDEPTDHAD